MYAINEPEHRELLNSKTRDILNAVSMGFWIFLAGIESSLLMVYLKNQLMTTSIAVFYLIIQINSMLFCFDYNVRSFLVQLLNLCIFGIYIHFGNIGLAMFSSNLFEHFIPEYIIFILSFQTVLVGLWRRYLKI